MIQRVQSLFLLVAAVAAIAVLFIPIGNIIDVSGLCLYQYDAFSLKKEGVGVWSTLYIAILWGASAILSLVTIFMFKNRPRQVMMNGINMLLMLAALVTMLYIYPNLVFEKKQFVTSTSMLEFNRLVLISLVPAVCLYLANMFIKKDEKKVRAADRLR